MAEKLTKGTCRCCKRPNCSINADDTVRFHMTDVVECQDPADENSRKCKGAGKPPVEIPDPEPGTAGFVCRVPAGPEGCGKVVELTANGRARSHLDGQGVPCPGGSDWPVRVNERGERSDMKPAGPVSPPGELLMDESVRMAGEFDPQDPEGPGEEGTVLSVHETDAQRMSRLTEAAIEVLGRRTPEQKLADAQRMDRVASEALGLPLDPSLYLHDESTCLQCQDDPDYCPSSAYNSGDVSPAERAADARLLARPDLQESLEQFRRGEKIPLDDIDPDTLMTRPDALPADALFDVTHRYVDSSGTEWVHGGEASVCRSPECCKHPRGFDYMDDGNGHSGSFCFLCGQPEPDCPPHRLESVAVDGRPVARCAACLRPWDQCEQENAESWKTPPDELALMPEGLRRTAESNPECWDCGHEVTPVVEQFDAHGKPVVIVWTCWDTCRNSRGAGGHSPDWCRPQLPEEQQVGRLELGEYFVRHTFRNPSLSRLVYRVDACYDGAVEAEIVSPGPYAGRKGELTSPSEEITCTNHEGTPRPRRGLDTSATSRSKPQPSPLPPPRTSSPAAPPKQPPTARPTARSSTPATAPTVTRRTASSGGTSSRTTSSVPTAKAGSSTPSAPTTARTTPVPDAFTTAKQAVAESDKYDRFGRYKLIHPKTGKKVAWTRATTYAKSIQDTFALSQWAQRMTLKGAALREDIVAAVSTLDVKQDKDRINALVEDAKKAAGNKVAANLGTAMHSYTEDLDKILVGMPVEAKPVPAKAQPTVDAYAALLRDFGLEPVPGLIEFTTAVLQYEIAGTSDRCYKVTRDITFKLHGRMVTLYAGEYVIGDVKSGATLDYGWLEICIQLAIYAQGLNTCGTWGWDTGVWGHPVTPENPEVQIKVRTDVGLIPHLPVDREPGAPLATLYAVDLDFGWAAAVLCGQVRSVRKEGNLGTALSVADLVDGPAPSGATAPAGSAVPEGQKVGVHAGGVAVRPPTLEERARAVTTQSAASAIWKEAVAARTPKAEVDRLVAIMKAKIESHVEKGA